MFLKFERYIKCRFPYSNRITPAAPKWDTWREPRLNTWAAQLKIITSFTAQVDQQKAVVEVRDAAVKSTNIKVDAAYTVRDATQAVLDLALRNVDLAYEEQGEMLATHQNEELYLSFLQSYLHFHTQPLRDREPF